MAPTDAANVEHKVTFCRICEPLCGMIATVEDGRLTALRPDKEHPLSAGFACPKGIAFTEVVNDPDRVTVPLRRTPDGFEPVSWDPALDDIAARLSGILRRHGSGAIAWYFGNPAAFSYSHLMSVMPFIKGIGRHSHLFTSSSQDTSNRLLASATLDRLRHNAYCLELDGASYRDPKVPPSPKKAAGSSPGTKPDDSGSTMMPLWSTPMPSSSSAQIMPSEMCP